MIELNSNKSIAFSPEFEYTISGNIHTKISSNSSFPAAYKIGDKVTIRYIPGFPKLAKINSFLSLYSGGIICFIIGIGSLLLRIFMLKIQYAKI